MCLKLKGGIKLKIYQIHELNTNCILMLIDKFSSAFEYYLNELVEREKCIRNVEKEKLNLEKECVESEVNLFGKITSRCPY